MSTSTKTFIIAFGGMIVLIFLDNLYKKYQLSGLGFKDYILGRNPMTELNFADENDKYSTPYASILNKEEFPNFKVTRSIKGQFEFPGLRLTLFQYQSCPFCCKVRTFLDYYGVSYDIVEVNPVMRREISFSKKYRKVPILLVEKTKPDNNECYALQLNDSTLIISTLTSYIMSMKPKSRHHNESLFNITRWYLNSRVLNNDLVEDQSGDIYKAQKATDELVNKYFLMIGDVDPSKYERMDPPLAEERNWRQWADNEFVHVLSPNIYRTMNEAKHSFNHFSNISNWEKTMNDLERKFVIQLGSFVMYFVSKSLKKKYHLKDDVRESLYDSSRYWTKALSNRKFLGGDKPNLGDLAVYANFCAIEGCEAFEDVMKKNSNLKKWFTNIRNEVHSNSGYNLIKNL